MTHASLEDIFLHLTSEDISEQEDIQNTPIKQVEYTPLFSEQAQETDSGDTTEPKTEQKEETEQ